MKASPNTSLKKQIPSSEDIDLIRDTAVLLENSHLVRAFKLMSLAKKLRPWGEFIVAKHQELAEKIASNGCFTVEQSFIDFRNRYLLSDSEDSTSRKFIISADINHIYSGLGCMLLILGPAWKYAKTTGRTLVIDWRNNPYTRSDPSINLFSRLFDSSSLASSGVDVIADDQVNTISFPNSILMPRTEMKHESGVNVSSNGRGPNPLDFFHLILSGIDSDAGTILPSLDSMYHLATQNHPSSKDHPQFCTFNEAVLLYRSLKPLPHIQEQINSFCDKNLRNEPTIGIHVRHGNGEEDDRSHFSSRVITEFESFIDNLVARIDKIAKQKKFTRYKLFLCTDSDQVILALRARVPNLLTREIWRPMKNQGVDFDHSFNSPDEGVQSAANALIDMQLLGKCDVAILTRPTSFACQVPYLQEIPGASFLTSNNFQQL